MFFQQSIFCSKSGNNEKKNFSGKTSLKLSSAKVEWNDDNPTGNNLGKRPKIFLSKSDQFLQKKRVFWFKNFLRKRSSGHVE